MINTPAAKFESDPCNAKPTAKPAAPSTATNEVVWNPIRWMAAITTMTTNT